MKKFNASENGDGEESEGSGGKYEGGSENGDQQPNNGNPPSNGQPQVKMDQPLGGENSQNNMVQGSNQFPPYGQQPKPVQNMDEFKMNIPVTTLP